MTADGAGGAWGCRLEGLRLQRFGEDGRVNFELATDQPVEIVAHPGTACLMPVMGRSGSGKSTLMNVLSATTVPAPVAARVHWTFPDGSTFEWRGDGTATAPLHHVRGACFGYAFQQARLLSHLTVAENLVLGLLNQGESGRRALERARGMLLPMFHNQAAEVARILTLFPAQLSGGERQRVALLMAVMRDPFVLFADEPTGSLDRETRFEVMQLLRAWAEHKPGERMLIWVTHHDRDPADNGVTDRLYVADGRIAYEHSPDGARWLPMPRQARQRQPAMA
jgi:putative ABC transport system ATP-binding protein